MSERPGWELVCTGDNDLLWAIAYAMDSQYDLSTEDSMPPAQVEGCSPPQSHSAGTALDNWESPKGSPCQQRAASHVKHSLRERIKGKTNQTYRHHSLNFNIWMGSARYHDNKPLRIKGERKKKNMAQKCEANATNVAKTIKPLLLVRYLWSLISMLPWGKPPGQNSHLKWETQKPKAHSRKQGHSAKTCLKWELGFTRQCQRRLKEDPFCPSLQFWQIP